MENENNSVLSHGLIWFGAAVSIAEILTGVSIAPLGFKKGIAAVILGHIIGCVLLYFAGLIGANTKKSAMETVKISFGEKGALLFSSLNVLQLVGWTAIMIFNGAAAAQAIFDIGGEFIWAAAIGVITLIWVVVGIKNLSRLNFVTMGALFILTIILSRVIFKEGGVLTSENGALSFGEAVELSAAMPISWLPLISDYTRNTSKPKKITFISTAIYFLTSCWMYIIGMGTSILAGQSDIAPIVLKAGIGAVGLIIVVASTATTTFLDVYSAGVSCETISRKLKEKPSAIAVCIIGTILAMFSPVNSFENFLYLIGSVFAPMIAIQIADVFVSKKDYSKFGINWINIIIWVIGFIIYRLFMYVNTPVGYTLPVMFIVILISAAVKSFIGGKTNVTKSV